ncbi:hypothetical protein J6590_011049 [Homalodisca vitripennis]|nr:hypothetical protein J6590_011049 [Homalodisca vitripennis]
MFSSRESGRVSSLVTLFHLVISGKEGEDFYNHNTIFFNSTKLPRIRLKCTRKTEEVSPIFQTEELLNEYVNEILRELPYSTFTNLASDMYDKQV